MEIRNLPTDWDEPHIVVGYGMEFGILEAMLEYLRDGDDKMLYCIVDKPDAYIEFIPVKEE